MPTFLRRCLLALLAVTLPVCTALAGAPVHTCRVKAEFPHDPATFTQGLFVQNGRMFESSGRFGKSFLAEVEPETGRHLRTYRIEASRFAEGIAPYQNTLLLLTWRSGFGFIHSLDDLSLLGSFAYRVPAEHSEGWGLTYDGARFILSSGTDELRFHQPEDFSPMGAVRVHDGGTPVKQLNELEYMDDLVLANIWKQDRIAVIDPSDGRVAAWIDLAPLRQRLAPDSGVANGIAWDPEAARLYVTGKNWDKLFEIAVDPAWHGTPPDGE